MPIRAARFMFTSPSSCPASITLPTHGTRQESERKLSAHFKHPASQGRTQNRNYSSAVLPEFTTRKTRETHYSLYICHTAISNLALRVHKLLILRNKHQNIW